MKDFVVPLVVFLGGILPETNSRMHNEYCTNLSKISRLK